VSLVEEYYLFHTGLVITQHSISKYTQPCLRKRVSTRQPSSVAGYRDIKDITMPLVIYAFGAVIPSWKQPPVREHNFFGHSLTNAQLHYQMP
jgi:hypothetical protein